MSLATLMIHTNVSTMPDQTLNQMTCNPAPFVETESEVIHHKGEQKQIRTLDP